MNFNKVILAGRLTRDPELRKTPGGVAICKLSLATNRTYTGNDGQLKEEVTFVEIDCFGKQAETIAKYFFKKSRIHLEGRLKLDSWEKNGEKRSRLTVVLEGFQFVDQKPATTGPAREEDYHGRGD